MNDFELLYYYRMKHEIAIQYLIESNEKIIWKIIHSFDLRMYESDVEDFYQICLAEMFQAAERFCEHLGASFKTYFYRCVKTRLLNHIMQENNKSLYQIKSAYALDGMVNEDNGAYAIDFVETKQDETNIVAFKMDLLKREEMLLARLKPIEYKVWKLKLMGFSYEEISIQVGVSLKKVDNLIAKIQKQIRKLN